jgi:hypothetical protein
LGLSTFHAERKFSMTIKAAVHIATSLAGFIAHPDDVLDWLPAPGQGVGDFGCQTFLRAGLMTN